MIEDKAGKSRFAGKSRKKNSTHHTAVEGKVFCASMADVFDKKAPRGQREKLWPVVSNTPSLDWQILTKRPGNIEKYLPDDWGAGYDNVWLGATVEDIKHGLPRMDALRKIPASIRFLSIEPLLEDLGEL